MVYVMMAGPTWLLSSGDRGEMQGHKHTQRQRPLSTQQGDPLQGRKSLLKINPAYTLI